MKIFDKSFITNKSKGKTRKMHRLITINSTDKTKRIVNKKEDMTCEVELKHEGLFEGRIVRISSSGRYEILLTKSLEAKDV